MGCSPWGHKELDTTEQPGLTFNEMVVLVNVHR